MQMGEDRKRSLWRGQKTFIGYALFTMMLVIIASQAHASVSGRAVFRQVRWPDRGSIHVLLHNHGPTPATLVRLFVGEQAFEPSASGFVVSTHLDELVGDLVGGVPDIPQKNADTQSLLACGYLPRDSRPGEVLWYWAPTYELKPGDVTELIIKFSNTPTEQVNVRLLWSDDQETVLKVLPVAAPVRLSSLVFAFTLDTVFAYVHNASRTPVEVDTVWLNGKRIDADRVKRIGFPAVDGSTGAVVVSLGAPLRQGDWCCILIEMPEGESVFGSARALAGFPVIAQDGGVMQLDRGFNQPDGVSLKVFGDISDARLDVIAERITRGRALPGFCSSSEHLSLLVSQPFIKYASTMCGELVDCAFLHLQPAEVRYLGPFNDIDTHYVQAKARYLRECFAPRPVFGQTILAHCYMVTNCKGLLRPEELRLRCYYMLSRGIRGILYRDDAAELAELCTEGERQALKREIGVLGQEFRHLRPYIRIADSVERLATCTEPLVEAATLLAGDKGLVLFLLNHDRQHSWPENEYYRGKSFFLEPVRRSFRVRVRVPNGLAVGSVEEIAGTHRYRVPFALDRDEIIFDVPSLYATRQYVLVGPGAFDSSAPASPEYPLRDNHGPRAVLPRKQAFLGRVSPSTGGYGVAFTCTNGGDAPLMIRYHSVDNPQVSVTPECLQIEPGKSTTFTATCSPLTSMFHEVLRLQTNDPCCPNIRLDIGGEIVPELSVSPTKVTMYPNTPSANIVVSDNTNGDRKITRACVRDERLAITIKETRYSVDRNTMDVYSAGETHHSYEVSVTPIQQSLAGRWRTDIVLATDSPSDEYKLITVPVIVMGQSLLQAHPKSVFLLVGKEPVEKSVSLTAGLGKCVIDAVTADHDFVLASVSKQGDDKAVVLIITCRPNDAKGVFAGDIRITAKCGDTKEIITVPYTITFL